MNKTTTLKIGIILLAVGIIITAIFGYKINEAKGFLDTLNSMPNSWKNSSGSWSDGINAWSGNLDEAKPGLYIGIGALVTGAIFVLIGITLNKQTNINQNKAKHASSTTQTDPYMRLQKLTSLYEQGLLTEEEYRKKREDIVSKL